ncbi:hypothetical protein CBI57_20225 [Pantoea agglomerans]|nr:hypothetical protein CBI57_20225 [Pantoea agglomerans]
MQSFPLKQCFRQTVSVKGLTGKNLAQVVSDTDAVCLATQINKLTEDYSEVQAIGARCWVR